MAEIRKDSRDFTGFEYKEIPAAGTHAAFCLDCYESFGWTLDGRMGESGALLLRRDRKLVSRAELTRLQRHFESCMDEIAALERSRTTAATAWSMAVGLLGTAFIAAAVFAATHVPPLWGLMTVLAIPGFAGWICPVFLYRKLAARRGKVVEELVERKYDEICGICGEGRRLME